MFKLFFNPKKSIQSRFFLSLLFLLLLTVSVLTFLWTQKIRTTAYESTLLHVVDTTKNAITNFDSSITDLSEFVKNISNSNDIVKNALISGDVVQKNKLLEYLNVFYDLHHNMIYGIAVANFSGKAYSVGSAYVPTNYINLDWVQNIINANGLCVATVKNLYINSQTLNSDKPCYITVGCTIFHYNTPIGFIFADVKPGLIINSYGQKLMNGITCTLLFDKNNNMVFYNNYLLKQHINENEIIDKIESFKDDFEEYYTFDYKIENDKYLALYYNSGKTSLKSIIFIPESHINKNSISAFKNTLITTICFFILTIILSMMLSGGIAKKIKRLESCMIKYNELTPKHLEMLWNNASGDEIDNLLVTFSKMLETIRQQICDIKTLSEQKRVLEISALERQISPHFLYNTLNTITLLAKIQGNQNIRIVSTSLINLLQFTLNSKKFVCVKEEIEYIKNYITIQQYKYESKINVIYEISEEILELNMLKMILQPIVENSFKHGLYNVSEGYIIIKGNITNQELELKVIDNGIGIPQDKINNILSTSAQEHSSYYNHIGLRNVNSRLKLSFGNQYGLHIFSILDMETIVTIKMPILKQESSEI